MTVQDSRLQFFSICIWVIKSWETHFHIVTISDGLEDKSLLGHQKWWQTSEREGTLVSTKTTVAGSFADFI